MMIQVLFYALNSEIIGCDFLFMLVNSFVVEALLMFNLYPRCQSSYSGGNSGVAGSLFCRTYRLPILICQCFRCKLIMHAGEFD
ncbi:hypothetical protein D3C71_1605010 [compost metagenome]